MGTILAIDYGLKRIGLAVSDPQEKLAFPFGVINNKNFNYVLSCLKEIIKDKEISLILVGMPYHINKNIDGNSKESSMVLTISEFVKKLQKNLFIPVKTVDEKLSTFSAQEKLIETGLSIKQAKKYLDQESARLILEEYLESSQSI